MGLSGSELKAMKACLFFLGWLSALVPSTCFSVSATLQDVAQFPDDQLTGVAVSQSGRVFVNFPYWSERHHLSVAEVVNGQPVAFPNAEWNQSGAPDKHFVCVQSVYVDESDSLWILDPAAPMMKEIVKGGPKLVKVDLVKNEIVQTIPFSEQIAPKKSYLNDVRIDLKTQTAFITDSGLGAIIIVDLRPGKRAGSWTMIVRLWRRKISDFRSTAMSCSERLASRRRSTLTESLSIICRAISTIMP